MAGGETPEDTEPSASALAAAQADLDIFVALSLASLLPPDGRVRLHPLLREYAHELWQSQPHEVQAQGLRALLAGIDTLVTAQRSDFAALAIEEEMIVAALDQAQATQAVPQYVTGIVNTLFDYLTTGGHWRLGTRLYPWQLAACREVGNRNGESTTLNNLGLLANSLGQPEEARGYYEQALVIACEMGDRSGEGTTLNNLGTLADSLGEKEQAREYYEQALPIVREVGNRSVEGTTLSNLGSLAYSLGEKEQARDYYEQALRIFHEIGAVDSERAVSGNLAYLNSLSAPTGDTANNEAVVPQEKTPQRKRRWPWSKQL